jgi:3-oxoacyl-[acyl-carrier-protein] synthase-3
VLVQDLMGIGTCPALDVRNQCSGFVYALSVADQYIRTGMYENILVIGSEHHSGGLDLSTRGRTVSVIFGDGAGAVVVSRHDNLEEGIQSTHLHSEGKHAKELSLIGPSTKKWVHEVFENYDPDDMDYHPYMNGQLVFKNALVRFSEVILEALAKNNLEPSDIDMLIPHQANLRIAQFVQKKFGLRDDQVYNNIMRYGNTTAASIPIALCEAWEEGRIKTGDHVMLAAFGSGFTWGSSLIKWV